MITILALALAADLWTPELQMQTRTLGPVAVSHDGKSTAWLESASGKRTLWIAGNPIRNWTESIVHMEFKPDGRLMIESPHGYYTVASDGAILAKVTRTGDPWKNFHLSADGNSYAFVQTQKDSSTTRIREVGDPGYKHQLICIASPALNGCNTVAPGYVGAISLSPDAKCVVFESRTTPFPNDSRTSDLYEADLATGALQSIAKSKASETQPHYSPDGKYIAYLRSDDPPLQPGDERIILYDRAAKTARELTPTVDRLPHLLGWSADSKQIFYQEDRGTRNAIYAMPLDGPPQTVFAPNGVAGRVQLNPAGTAFAMTVESSSEPAEVFTLAPGGKPKQATQPATSNPPVGKTEVVWWRSRDNLEIEGLLTYPVNYESGKKYPLVMILHGGPYGHFDESFIGKSGIYPIASFSAKGYAVFRPNPRASTGYGRDFRFQNLKDWGGEDYQDVITGARSIVAMGVADASRMSVMGWSYGGFLTSWVIGHTNEFKAAAIGAGVSNLISQTGTSDIRSNKIDAFGAPWDNLQFYLDRSPIKYVKNVQTPVLILGGDADERVPISQSYELYNALKALGKTAKMVVYPGAPHGPTDPEYVLDLMKRHIEWVETYAK